MPGTALSAALHRLYGAPLDDFVTVRKAIAAELRTAGEGAASKAVGAAPKPTRTAWALDQISRRQPELARALLRAWDQASGGAPNAEGMRQATREYRERLNDLTRAARDFMVESGMELNAVQLRRVTETLEAACATDGEVRAQLLDGTLARDVEVDDSVEVLAAGGLVEREPRRTEPGGERAHEAERAKEKEREKERERREREQRLQAVAATRGEIAELEGAAREALARLRAAQAETERARRVSEEADARLAQAREKLAKLDGSRHRS